jgi:hypothetical protein
MVPGSSLAFAKKCFVAYATLCAQAELCCSIRQSNETFEVPPIGIKNSILLWIGNQEARYRLPSSFPFDSLPQGDGFEILNRKPKPLNNGFLNLNLLEHSFVTSERYCVSLREIVSAVRRCLYPSRWGLNFPCRSFRLHGIWARLSPRLPGRGLARGLEVFLAARNSPKF